MGESKTDELAETDEKNAQAKVDMEDTKASLSADEQFLMKLKEKCQMTDKEWEAQKEKEGVVLELEQLSNYNAELHQSCDFVLKNFDLRQTARDEEVEALRQAKAILSGAKFEEFL